MSARIEAYTTTKVTIGTITSNKSTSATLTFSHTVSSGSNLALLALIGTHQGTISSVIWNGTPLVKLGSGRSTLNECADAWILINPTPATGNLVITRSSGSWTGAIAVNLSNVQQSIPTNISTGSGNATSASISITPYTGYNLIVGCIGTEAAPTKAAGLTSLAGVVKNQSYENMEGVYIQAPNRLAQTLSFTLVPGKRYGIVALAIEPAVVTQTPLRIPSGTRITSGTRLIPHI